MPEAPVDRLKRNLSEAEDHLRWARETNYTLRNLETGKDETAEFFAKQEALIETLRRHISAWEKK